MRGASVLDDAMDNPSVVDAEPVTSPPAEGRRGGFARLAMHDSAIYLPATIIQGIGGIAVTAIISKLSTPADYGNYTLGISLATALAMLAGQWLNESVIRFWPEFRRQGALASLYSTLALAGAATTLVLACAALGVIIAVQPRRAEGLYPFLLVASGIFPLAVVFGVINSWNRVSGRAPWFSLFMTWRVLGGLALGVFLALVAGMHTIGFLWGIAGAWAVVVLGFIVRWRRSLRALLRLSSFSVEVLTSALRYSMPLTGIALAGLLLSISDRYLIGGFLNSYSVGIYALAYAVAQRGMELVIQPFSHAFQPISFRVWAERGQEATLEFVSRLSRYFAMGVLPLATGLAVVARPAVRLMSTDAYLEGAQVVGIVAAAMVFYGYARMYEESFALTKNTFPLLVIYLVTTGFNLILNVLGIPRYGYMFAAWSTLASYALMMIITAVWSSRVLPLPLFGWWIWKPLAGSLVMAGVVAGLGSLLGESLWALAVQIVVGIGVYLLVMFLLRAFSMEELSELRNMIRSRAGRRMGSRKGDAG